MHGFASRGFIFSLTLSALECANMCYFVCLHLFDCADIEQDLTPKNYEHPLNHDCARKPI